MPIRSSSSEVRSGGIQSATFKGDLIVGERSSGGPYVTHNPETDNTQLIGLLDKQSVKFDAAPPERQGFLLQLFISSFPILLLIGVWIYFMRQMQGGAGGRGAMSFGKSRARLLSEDQVSVTFADVAGVDEAKEEVAEIVDFLKDPSKFQKLGGKIPKGVLMVGSPGTGKTLLARAIAGEAKVPFFTISGSDFVEMFVGVGASRVRDMFEQAKKHAPCIVFIDEIDAVGRHRGAGLGGGHDEREQTLNQLLVEMDGFEGNEGVIVIAATNRPDVLDPALLRPGRFDRQVVVPLPDVRGREQILKVHMRKVPISDDVRPGIIARGTPGFSGADLMNLVNEAALFAARANKRLVTMDEFERAKDKIMMGAERRSMVMSETGEAQHRLPRGGTRDRRHEPVPEHDPVYKVTIMPRGRALGVTMFLPEEDRYSYSKRRIMGQITSLFGGRLAEELHFGPDAVTTGRIERHRARHQPRAQHGHEMGTLGTARPAGLHGGRGRGVPRSLGDAAQAGFRRDGPAPSTRKCAASSTRATRTRAGSSPTTARSSTSWRRRSSSTRPRRRAAQRHHGRPHAAGTDGLGRDGRGFGRPGRHGKPEPVIGPPASQT